MTSVAVLIPVLNRPEAAAAVAGSVRASDARATPVFLCNTTDTEEILACAATGEQTIIVPWEPGPGDWARKLNLGFKAVQDEWVLLGADDLRFHPGWFDAALLIHSRSHACVIGTNDLGNARVQRGQHSTHPLVHRDYLDCGTADEAGLILHEGYVHQYVDDEFVQTAQVRRTFAFARDSHVEHLHPDWGKGEWDGTYQRGKDGFEHDRVLYNQRKTLWLHGRP